MKINRKYLPYVAGFLWLTVGLGLMLRGLLWWKESFEPPFMLIYGLLLIPIAYLFSSKILSQVSQRTLDHIRRLPEKVCFFAFQPTRSYLLMAIMIAIGLILRHSPLPRAFLGALYVLMGLSLSIGSSNFVKL